ncbi:MAG: hypothetical protein LCH52_03780 [Bacteroidetes bacterium]|nr:hypothetical protein [Bacteroidota bacterium]
MSINNSRAGIKRLVIWNAAVTEGDLNAANIIDLNIRTAGSAIIDDETVDDVKGRQLPLYKSFKIEASAHNIGRPLGYYLLNHAKTGETRVEAVLTPSTSGVLQITGSNYLGLDYEYTFTGQERVAKITLEGKFDFTSGSVITDAMVTNTLIASSSLGLSESYQFETAQYFSPAFGMVGYKATSGSAYTVAFESEEIKERSFTLKTVGRKNVYNKSVVDYLEATAEYTILNASPTKYKALNDLVKTNFAPGVKIQERNSTGAHEVHEFQVGVLSLKNMATFGEDDRFLKLTFKGKIPLDQISYADVANTYTYTL